MQDLPLDRLGPFPILQLAAALLVIGGLALAVWRGVKDRKSSNPIIPDEQRWFFDGPLTHALNVMRDNRGYLERVVELNEEQLGELRDHQNLLRDIHNKLDIISRQR